MRSKFKWIFPLLLTFFFQFSYGQERNITGVVSDESGPLPGAAVIVKGTNTGTQTDFDGKYSIRAKSGDVLEISYTGLKTQAITVGASSNINVTMQEDVAELDAVVVTAYGRTKTRNELTGSVVTVKSEDIAKTTFASADQALQGRVAGLTITNTSGTPGAAQVIRIRGVNSISATNEPLWVIDGVPMSQGNYGGSPNTSSLSHMAFMSNDDIESMTVLKDAAAVAAYGSSGANGVILITTKKGKKGDAKFSVSSSIGVQNNAVNGLTPLNSEQKAKLIEDAVWNQFGTTLFPQNGFTTRDDAAAFLGLTGISPQYNQWASNPDRINTNWYEDHLRNRDALMRIVDVSTSGGDDKSNFSASLGLNETEATVIGSDFKRITGSFRYSNQLTDRLKLSVTFQGSNVRQNAALENGAFFSNPNLSRYFLSPWLPAFNDDGTPYFFSPTETSLHNTIFTARENIRRNDITRAIQATTLEYAINKNLTFKTMLNLDYSVLHYKDYRSPLHGDGFAVNGLVFEQVERNLNYTAQNMLDYKVTIADKHSLNLTAISEFTKYKDNFLFGLGQNMANDFLQNISAASANFDAESLFSDRMSLRYAGLASYVYDNKYVLDVNYSYQGDSRFDPNNRFDSFYGVGAAWNIHEEEFAQQFSKLNRLSLRGGIGTTGNSGIGRNLYQSLVSFNQYGGNPATWVNRYGSQVGWETGIKRDIALEFGFFDNRLTGSVGYFSNETKDGLLADPLPFSAGFGTNLTDGGASATRNIYDMTNKGFELELNFLVVNTPDVKWNIGGNFSTLANKITSLRNASGEPLLTGATRIREEGYTLDSWFLPIWAGVDSDNGDPLWYVDDTRTTTTNVYAEANRQHANSSFIPTYSGGINTRLDVKNFFFEALVYFQGGNQVYEDWASFTQTANGSQMNGFNGTTVLLNGAWTTPGQEATHPRMGWADPITDNAGNASSRWLRDGDFVRLRDIAVGYTFKRDIVKQIGLDGVSMSVRGANLLTWTKDKNLKYDPEVTAFTNLTNPPVKSVVFQLNLNF